MLRANIEAQIEAKQKEIEKAESEIDKISKIIESLKAQRRKFLEIRGLAAYDVMELQDQLDEMEEL